MNRCQSSSSSSSGNPHSRSTYMGLVIGRLFQLATFITTVQNTRVILFSGSLTDPHIFSPAIASGNSICFSLWIHRHMYHHVWYEACSPYTLVRSQVQVLDFFIGSTARLSLKWVREISSSILPPLSRSCCLMSILSMKMTLSCIRLLRLKSLASKHKVCGQDVGLVTCCPAQLHMRSRWKADNVFQISEVEWLCAFNVSMHMVTFRIDSLSSSWHWRGFHERREW